MDWKTQYQEKLRTPAQAVQVVRNGDRIYAGTSSSIAYPLIDALYQRRDELEGVVLCHGMINRQLPIFTPEAKGHFSTTTYFAGAGCRTGIQNGLTTFTSFHLSQIDLWCREVARPNIAFLEVSPPDEEGYILIDPQSLQNAISVHYSDVKVIAVRNIPPIKLPIKE